ncbi:HTH-type transcriptional activator RhaR [Abditibacteriota bacterium]|nr:HTH-type transcriptional activator RhaR [Abditibacteriota bacterium]
MLSSRPLEAQLPPWGVSVLESHHARDFQTVFDAHPFFQLLYVLRGRGELVCPPDTRFSLCEGDVALLPPATSHGLRDEVGAALSIYAVNLAPSHLQYLSPVLTGAKRVRREPLQRAMPDLLRRLLLEQTLRKDGFEAMMSGLALQLLGTVWRSFPSVAAPEPDASLRSLARVEVFRAELERTFYKNQGVDEVAARLGLSRRAFTSLFRRATGDSFVACVKKLRVEHAQRLLESSDRTVLAVAFECGFEDVSVFHRAFKAVTGTSPNAWRKRTRS